MNVKQIFASSIPFLNYVAVWDIPDISPRNYEEITSVGWEVVETVLDAPWATPAHDGLLAFDPGYAEAGLCRIHREHATLWQCNIKSGQQYKNPPLPEIARRIHVLVSSFTEFYSSPFVVENSAFGKPFGQSNLGLVRGVFAGIALNNDAEFWAYAPSQIKAAVHTTKIDYHKESKHYGDALAAFAIALAAAKEL